MTVFRKAFRMLCTVCAVGWCAAVEVAQSPQPAAERMVVAQNKVDLEAPPPDFVTKGDAASPEAKDTPEVKAPRSPISLSISGSVAAQITSSSGSGPSRPGSNAGRGR